MNTAWNVLLLLLICGRVEVSARGGRSGGGRGGSFGGGRANSGANGAYSGAKSRTRLSSSRNTVTSRGSASGGFFGGMRLWTLKTTGSIARPSSRFQAYAAGATAGYLISRPSRTFYYSNNHYNIESSDNVCEAAVGSDEIGGYNLYSQEDTSVPVFFACDGKCCEVDCCELNVGFVLFIVGTSFFTVVLICLCCYCDNAKQPSADDKEWFNGKEGNNAELFTLPTSSGNPLIANRFANRQPISSTIYPPTPDLPGATSSHGAQKIAFAPREHSDGSISKLKAISAAELEKSYMT